MRTLQADADALRGGLAFSAADRYQALIYPEFACAADYLPAEALVFFCDHGNLTRAARQRQEHLKRLEKDIFNRYKPVIKSFTKGQGKVLLKLINRETNQSSYNIVKAFLGSFRAGFWQTFGRFFGMNMKVGFNPGKSREDAVIDRVATLIEQGTL